MLNEILEPFKDYFSFLNLFEYITFRAGASAILSLLFDCRQCDSQHEAHHPLG